MGLIKYDVEMNMAHEDYDFIDVVVTFEAEEGDEEAVINWSDQPAVKNAVDALARAGYYFDSCDAVNIDEQGAEHPSDPLAVYIANDYIDEAIELAGKTPTSELRKKVKGQIQVGVIDGLIKGGWLVDLIETVDE